MNPRYQAILSALLSFGIMIVMAVAFIFALTYFVSFFTLMEFPVLLIMIALMAGVVASFVSPVIHRLVFGESQLPPSYRVAIVGLPLSGKTTLITSLFREAFARRISKNIKLTPRGDQTIKRINRQIEMLDAGRAIGPTRDQDMFAFRAELTVERFPIPSSYRIELGDFSGKDSQVYAESRVPPNDDEFYRWIADSDAIVMVVDIGAYLLGEPERKTHVASVSSFLRGIWQHFLDVNADRSKEVKRHTVILVFTKADLIGREKKHDPFLSLPRNVSEEMHRREAIRRWAFGERLPPVAEMDSGTLDKGMENLKEDFRDLITYLRSEAPSFRMLFTSSFGLSGGRRLGIADLLDALIPR